ncbi:MAG: hypothetical protein ACXAC7_18705 [Candidatus Hodarchaeales archaeon]|jgi:hypothetical protein
MVIRHWALFIEGDQVKWTYGLTDQLTDQLNNTTDSKPVINEIEFQQTTVGFIQSLQAIGRELYSEGVASIKLAHPSRSSLMANEVFIVNLSDQFFFIISDLAVTARLIAQQRIPYEIEQIICAVLVGQGSILYSTLVMDEEQGGYNTDKIFRDILLTLEVEKRIKIDELVDRGRVSLSSLNMTELLLFHYLLRNYFESQSLKASLSSQAWSLMVDSSGTDIPLSWMPPKDPYLLGNFLGAIYSYVQALFGTKPSAIIFGGGHELIYLQFFGGNKYFLAASNPQLLIRDPVFVQLLNQVPKKKFQDIERAISQFITNQTLNHLDNMLHPFEYSNLIALLYNLENSQFNIRKLTLKDIPGLGSKTIKTLEKVAISTLEQLKDCNCEKIIKKLPTSSRITIKRIQLLQRQATTLLKKTGGFEISISTLDRSP